MPGMPAGLGEVFRGASAGRALQMDLHAACSHSNAGRINSRASLQALGRWWEEPAQSGNMRWDWRCVIGLREEKAEGRSDLPEAGGAVPSLGGSDPENETRQEPEQPLPAGLKEKEALPPLPITHKDIKGPNLGRQRWSCLQQH